MHPRWLSAVLDRVRDLGARRKVHFTLKAVRELAALDLGLDEDDACDVLATLTADEFDQHVRSKKTREWMYVFKPRVSHALVYLKVILRVDCIVVSFHEEEGNE